MDTEMDTGFVSIVTGKNMRIVSSRRGVETGIMSNGHGK